MKCCAICQTEITGEAVGCIMDVHEELLLCPTCCRRLEDLTSSDRVAARLAHDCLQDKLTTATSSAARAFLLKALNTNSCHWDDDKMMDDPISDTHQKGRETMTSNMYSSGENQFCNQCGMLISECTCGAREYYAPQPVPAMAQPEPPAKVAPDMPAKKENAVSYISRFEKIALTEGEEIVRKYVVGQFDKGLRGAGSGEATVIITNKRIISRQSSECMGTSHTSVEELALDNIAGVRNFFSQGFTVWRIVAAIGLFMTGIMMLFAGGFPTVIMGLALLAAAAYMAHNSRKPSYLFSVYASATGSAMETGVNLRGKLFNSGGNGILFQYKPTEEAITMMCEMGACIMDLKTQGNFAVKKWKKG